jgi:hypothetical protein
VRQLNYSFQARIYSGKREKTLECPLNIVTTRPSLSVRQGSAETDSLLCWLLSLLLRQLVHCLPNMPEAGAASKTSPVTCGTLASAPSDYNLFLFGSCSHPFLTGGSGSNDTNSLTWVIAWKTHKTLTVNISLLDTGPEQSCGSNLDVASFDYGGKVVGASGRNTRHFLGDPVSFDLCINLHDFVAVGLVPGTEFTIG